MKRDLKRVYEHHGVKYFAFPIIVSLAIAVIANQNLDGYLDNREEAADLENLLDKNRDILELNKKIQRNHDELSTSFAPIQQKFFVTPDITESVNAMQGQLRKQLQDLYFENVEFFGFSENAQANVSRIEINARFTGVPQQITRLQAALAQSPKILAIENLEIKVVDDIQRGGKQLAITARFASLHMKPLPEANSAKEAPKQTAARP